MFAEYADAMTRAMFGQDARQVAFNFVLQDGGKEKGRHIASIVGTTQFADLMGYGFKKTHCLVLCDAVIRPHLVIESDHLVGVGAAGILTSSSMASVREWVRNGHILVNNLPSRIEKDK